MKGQVRRRQRRGDRLQGRRQAAVILVPLLEHDVAVKASAIQGDIPLLMSKPALSCLGLILDLGNNVATFRKLRDGDVERTERASGHAIVVDHSRLASPDTSKLPDSLGSMESRSPVRVRFTHDGLQWGGNLGDDHECPGDDDVVAKIFYDKTIDR